MRIVAKHLAARQHKAAAIPSRSRRHAKSGPQRPERFVDASTKIGATGLRHQAGFERGDHRIWRGLELLHRKDAATSPTTHDDPQLEEVVPLRTTTHRYDVDVV